MFAAAYDLFIVCRDNDKKAEYDEHGIIDIKSVIVPLDDARKRTLEALFGGD